MAGAASALFLLDIKGRVLVWRDYRGDVTAAQAERFFTKLIEKEVSLLFPIFDFLDVRFGEFVFTYLISRCSLWDFLVNKHLERIRLEFDQC